MWGEGGLGGILVWLWVDKGGRWGVEFLGRGVLLVAVVVSLVVN